MIEKQGDEVTRGHMKAHVQTPIHSLKGNKKAKTTETVSILPF